MSDYFSLSKFSTTNIWHIYTKRYTFRVTQTIYSAGPDEVAHVPFVIEVKTVGNDLTLVENWKHIPTDGPIFSLEAVEYYVRGWLAAQ